MAAYAAVISLMNNLEQIQNHPHLSTSLDKEQIELLGRKVCFLQHFLESYSNGGTSREAEDLEREIACAALEAEDVIESHIVDQIHAGSTLRGITSSSLMFDIQRVLQEMDLIEEKAMKFKSIVGFKDQVLPTHSEPATSSNNAMVGFDDELIQLMEWLTGQRFNRIIIPIVGMGGIGKTTLARNVYENLLIVQHFDVRAWVTITQEYNLRKILLQLLSCLSGSERETSEYTDDQLGEKLYKSLLGRRYLIILDDIWGVEVWDELKFFIPENDNRSRVIVTTRLTNLIIHFGSSYLAKKFLDWERSWSLFCDKGFGQEGCPLELEDIGKKVVEQCRGLPLSIVVIGGLLGKYRRKEYWERVAKDMNSIVNSREYEHCFNVLYLSYSHLPAHLKPCFLYLGIFPEDHMIRASQFIKLWVAEGFLKPNKTQVLEEVAMGYLKDLVDRNLIFVLMWSWNGKINTCIVHDLIRELCLRIAKKEKFLCVTREDDIPQGIDRERHIAFHERIQVNHHHGLFDALHSTSLARSLIFKGGVWSFQCRLLRVLDVEKSDPKESIFELVNLRYLSCIHDGMFYRHHLEILIFRLPSAISLLWNLQTIIIKGFLLKVIAPPQIWEMPQLRHVETNSIILPDPPSDQRDGFVLRNLHTLLEVENYRLSEEVCKRIPNVKKLHVNYGDLRGKCKESSYYCLYNLGCLHKLESLKFSFFLGPKWNAVLQKLIFPDSLKKLALRNCFLHWEELTMIGSLPNLEVLKLDMDSVKGTEWNPVEGQFLRLKVLKISYLDLIYWNANSFHFPVLENLFFSDLLKLDEIPLSIGEIPTLRLIRLYGCSVSAAVSAMKIMEEQESLGNDGLRVRVHFWDEVKLQSFREEMEKESSVSSNFHID